MILKVFNKTQGKTGRYKYQKIYWLKTGKWTTEKFTDILRETLDKHAPIIEVIPGQKKKYVPWYNDEKK